MSNRATTETPRDLFEMLAETSDLFGLTIRHSESAISGTMNNVFELGDVPLAEQTATRREYDQDRLDRPRKLLESLLASLPPEVHGALRDEDRLLVAELRTADLNAQAMQAGNGGWLIVLNEGLVTFIYKANRALARHFAVGGPSSGPRIESEPTADLIATVFDWYQATGFPFGPDFEVNWDQMRLASMLTTDAERFLVAHELGHHVLGHVESGTQNMLVNRIEVPALNTSKAQELEADAFALRLIIASLLAEDSHPVVVARAYAGIEMLFHAVDMMETYSGAPEADTHPSARVRLQRVRNLIASEFEPEVVQTISGFATAIDQLLTKIRPHVLDSQEQALLDRERERAGALLAELLATHRQGAVPDYMGFYAVVSNRLFDLPASAWCGAVADRLNAAKAMLESASEAIERGDTPSDPDRLAATFVELKLILGLLSHQQAMKMGVQELLDWSLGDLS